MKKLKKLTLKIFEETFVALCVIAFYIIIGIMLVVAVPLHLLGFINFKED
jgi:hypothetical protein